ncbi:helix-turn-helix transcriptional regulator [Novosphingobium sp. ZN18A2]|uniref:helix-turn-helix domain-containing protein n=1 Tax=Novosphingobium sp. ZN18A2 TaxID=3079861 RepID=UPI0030CC7A1E
MVAKQLSVHPRTLQNRLLAEGLEFREIIKNERRKLAESYLGSTRTPIAEIAVLLGYADQTSFTRAFSGWFSMSPRKFRRSRQGSRAVGNSVQ